ncbi:MAG: hypothetical protein P8X69_12355 [Maritimibacter sp.]
MSFWEFLLKSTIKFGPVEVNGFAVLVLTLVASLLAIRIGWKASEAIVRRLGKDDTQD